MPRGGLGKRMVAVYLEQQQKLHCEMHVVPPELVLRPRITTKHHMQPDAAQGPDASDADDLARPVVAMRCPDVPFLSPPIDDLPTC